MNRLVGLFRFLVLHSRLRYVFRAWIGVALAALVAVAAMCSDAKADSYTWVVSGRSFSTATLACSDVSNTYAALLNRIYAYVPYIFSANGCSGPHDGVTGHSFTVQYYNATSDTYGTNTATLTAIVADLVIETPLAESAVLPDMARRVSSYPVGEVVVMCAGLLMFGLGIRAGMSL